MIAKLGKAGLALSDERRAQAHAARLRRRRRSRNPRRGAAAAFHLQEAGAENVIREPALVDAFCGFAQDALPLLAWGWDALTESRVEAYALNLTDGSLGSIHEGASHDRRGLPGLYRPSAHLFCRLRRAGRACQRVAARNRPLRGDRRPDRRLSRQDRQRRGDGRASEGRRAADPDVLRLRGRAEHPAPVRPGRGSPPAQRRLSRPARDRLRRRRAARRAPDRPPACRSGPDVVRLRRAAVRVSRRAPVARQLGAAKGEDGLEDYRRKTNAVSIDGLPTGLADPL